LTTNTEQKENKTTFPKTSPAIAFTPTEYQSNTLLKKLCTFCEPTRKVSFCTSITFAQY